ncbi:hypothetical protein [Sediminibacterium soli]|uniref:hypothetical protein n=1 Tax=Sediminibacterium soli TaxID=2698829 RepID=UPI00137B2658|nr:hypothetical protein [Sediminibacterium soli]NCI47526.1 hypothetical protein [Sediminibacterium soli]
MEEKNEHLDALRDIRSMMEKSSRFISLSGLSGIAAGCCALAAAFYIWWQFNGQRLYDYTEERNMVLVSSLLAVGLVTFAAAIVLAFLFTYLRSRKTGIPIWGNTAQRLMLNTAIPLLVGGVVVLKLLQMGVIALVAPVCLLFYGLALINGSKYTLREIRWLGFSELLLGMLNLWMTGYGLFFWALGFGVLHILYGAIMWWKYEKQ